MFCRFESLVDRSIVRWASMRVSSSVNKQSGVTRAIER